MWRDTWKWNSGSRSLSIPGRGFWKMKDESMSVDTGGLEGTFCEVRVWFKISDITCLYSIWWRSGHCHMVEGFKMIPEGVESSIKTSGYLNLIRPSNFIPCRCCSSQTHNYLGRSVNSAGSNGDVWDANILQQSHSSSRVTTPCRKGSGCNFRKVLVYPSIGIRRNFISVYVFLWSRAK